MKFRLVESKNPIYSVELNSDMTDITFYVFSENRNKLKSDSSNAIKELKKFVGIGLESPESESTQKQREKEFDNWLSSNNYIYLCSEDNPDDLEYEDGQYLFRGREIIPVYKEHFRF